MDLPINVKAIEETSIEILPLFDWHLGSHECDEALVDRIIKHIQENENCYTFIGGDLGEFCVYDGKMNSVHHQKHQVTEQVEMIIKKLEPIKEKILFSVCGNHEARIEKSTGLDVAALIALSLNVPYFKWETHFILKLISAKSKKERKNIYIYAHHGCGGGASSGGKINAIERLHFRAPFAHIIFAGHTHIASETRELIPYLSQAGNMKNFVQYFISCGTSHKSDGYAAMKAYRPIPVGAVKTSIRLTPDNEVRCDTIVFE